MFDRSKFESLRDVSVTRIGDILSYGFPQTVYGLFYWKYSWDFELLIKPKFENGFEKAQQTEIEIVVQIETKSFGPNSLLSKIELLLNIKHLRSKLYLWFRRLFFQWSAQLQEAKPTWHYMYIAAYKY